MGTAVRHMGRTTVTLRTQFEPFLPHGSRALSIFGKKKAFLLLFLFAEPAGCSCAARAARKPEERSDRRTQRAMPYYLGTGTRRRSQHTPDWFAGQHAAGLTDVDPVSVLGAQRVPA